jgi:hypothetical protein
VSDHEVEPEAEFDTLAAGEDIHERHDAPWGVILVAGGLLVALLVSCMLF